MCYKDNVNPYPELPGAPPEAAQYTLSPLPWLNTALEVDWGRRLRSSAVRMMIVWFMHHVCYVLWYLAPEVTCRYRNIITQITGEILTLAILTMQRIVMIARMLIMPRMVMIPMQKLLISSPANAS